MEKDQQQQQHHQFLPNEITIDILSRLPADSIIRFKRVCKAWRSIVEEDPVFLATSLGFVKLENVDNNTTHYYVCFAEYKHHDDDQKVMNFKRWRLPIKDDYPRKIHESLTIVGSCNGLICISAVPDYYCNQSQDTTLLVCNPLTGEVVNLSQDSSIDSLALVGIGFGYLPSTNEYKIVRIYASSLARRLKHVQVYTLGSGKWRSIVSQIRSSWADITFSFSFRIGEISQLGVSVNGALYFNNRRNIVSFDLAKEEFRIIVSPPPTPPFTTGICIGGLGVLEGRLCATYSSRYFISSTMTTSTIINTDLWVLMEEMDDDKEMEEDFPWIKIFSLPPQRREYDRMYYFYGYRPLGTMSPPPRILLQSNSSLTKEGILSYNPETDHLCCRDIDGDKRMVMVIPYM